MSAMNAAESMDIAFWWFVRHIKVVLETLFSIV